LVLFSDAFDEILLHLVFGEGKVVVDVEGADKDFFVEVGLVVEGLCLFMIDELNLDDAILAVD